MILEIKVYPRSSKEEIKKIEDNSYKVYMHKPAVEGEANRHLIMMLSRYLGIKKSYIRIKSGIKSKNKIIEVEK